MLTFTTVNAFLLSFTTFCSFNKGSVLFFSSFYKNYAAFCARSGKSLSAVAEEVGLSRTSPNGWKKDKLPRDSTLIKLADYFGVSVDELISDHEKKPAPEIGNELDIEAMINNMSREELISFIMAASSRLQDLEK